MNKELVYEVETRSLFLFSDNDDSCSVASFKVESPDLYWVADDCLKDEYDSTTSTERKSRISKKPKTTGYKRLAERYLGSLEVSVARLRNHKESFTHRFRQLKVLVKECKRRQLKQKTAVLNRNKYQIIN